MGRNILKMFKRRSRGRSFSSKNYKVNVKLAATWYNLSCWTIYKKSIHQIQRLVHNYIWFGKEDHGVAPRWRGLYSHHLRREEDWVLLTPSHNPKPYLPNLWCEDPKKGMTDGKCYAVTLHLL